MSLKLYWLDGKDGHRFGPYSWRIRMALAHKGLEPELVGVKFTGKDRIAFSGQERVPVLVDGEHWVADSWAIATYLEETYAEAPSLFGDAIGRGAARFVNGWADSTILPGIAPLIIKDVFETVLAEDREYFRKSREARFGKSLEEVQEGREERVAEFRKRLAPLRATVAEQSFVCGERPAYADHICFGCFMWPRGTSPFRLIEPDDPIYAWRERMLDLYGGLARAAPGHPL